MKVKWKNTANLRPGVILEKLGGIQIVGSDGSISYQGFEYHEIRCVLLGLLSFPPRCDSLDHERILAIALRNISRVGRLDENAAIEEINRIANQELSTRENQYFVLTSISLRVPTPIRSISVEKSKIRILPSDYPKKYSSRTDFLKNIRRTDATPTEYAKVIVSVNDRSFRGAEKKAQNSLGLLRASMCFNANTGIELFGGSQWSPINKVRLGEVHTVHRKSGKVCEDMYWFEPFFEEAQAYKASNPDRFSNNTKWVLSSLNKLKYRSVVKEALLRFVRALDQRDQNIALVRLWSALEILTLPSGQNYDLLTRRCSFLFSEAAYHQQVLEHIREYRNSNVHSGEENDKVKSYCFLLQTYFRELILFHLRQSSPFTSLDEANSFLDLPPKKSKLNEKKKMIERAIRFRA